jgi:hypothetical protein
MSDKEITLTVHGYDAAQVQERVAQLLVEQVDAHAREAIRERVDRLIEERLGDVTTERMRGVLEEIIADGWQRTNNYGEAVGPKLGFRERATKELFEPTGCNRARPIDDLFRETLNAALNKELGEVIKQATAQFRALVDETLQGKLRDALKSALGLGR